MRFTTLIISLIFITQTAQSEEKEQLLQKSFLNLKASILQHQFEFRCGFSTFKLEKTLFGGIGVYWHSGLDWQKMKNLKIKPNGLSFEGLGGKAGIPKTRFNIHINLPLYNIDDNHQSPLDYFTVKESNVFIPYSYDINFYSGEIIKRNVAEVTSFLKFDSATYLKKQRIIKTPQPTLPSPITGTASPQNKQRESAFNNDYRESYRLNNDANTDKQQSGKLSQQTAREASVRDAIKRYSTPIKVITQVYGYSNTSHCQIKQ